MGPDKKALRVAQVMWPSFLMAGLLSLLVFSAVDPATLTFGGGGLDPTSVYSVSFLLFWGIISAAVAVSQWMAHPVDAQSVPVIERSSKPRQRRVRRQLAQQL